jgi:5-methyltetrahydropteroyltriglutamate--homocysteine methyltransferase
MNVMIKTANLGFPRVGVRRELKTATENYWKGAIDTHELKSVSAELRLRHWTLQREAGIEIIPSNDFSLYDQMLDMIVALGAVPSRFTKNTEHRSVTTARDAMADAARGAGDPSLDLYFAMARGSQEAPAMEMTKWFDTNYHYIVPEFVDGQRFAVGSLKAVEEFVEAKRHGIITRPVLIGPVTFSMLGKAKSPGLESLSLLDALLPVYEQILWGLAEAGAPWVQMDEPVLALDLDQQQRRALRLAYRALGSVGPMIMVASYFGGLGDNLAVAADLAVSGHHLDLVRAPDEMAEALAMLPKGRTLSLGVVDGRNIWRTDLSRTLSLIEAAISERGGNGLEIAPSCSLLHSPVDLDHETKLDPEVRPWLAFARQKLDEVATLGKAARDGRSAVAAKFDESDRAARSRAASRRVHDATVAAQLGTIKPQDMARQSPFAVRRAKQRAAPPLPPFPTTTIGSFPQTSDVRKARAAFERGDMEAAKYESFLKQETERTVRIQEELGIDVLVHGEFERNDMVEYFGEQLSGFVFTQNGWVQFYGSRCVKPPIIFGDISRPQPMTVKWSTFAQSLTAKPMKGMLTGPVTILQWSFVRNDQPDPKPAVRSHSPSATRSSTLRRRASALSRSTSRRCVRVCRFAERIMSRI